MLLDLLVNPTNEIHENWLPTNIDENTVHNNENMMLIRIYKIKLHQCKLKYLSKFCITRHTDCLSLGGCFSVCLSFLDLSGKVINQANKIRRELINYHEEALTFKRTSKYPKEKTNLPLRNNSPIKLTKKNILSDKKLTRSS